MKQSQLFTKTLKDAKTFDSINATYLIKAGFIHQTMAGAYSFLPLGLRVLNKIEDIIRREMNTIGIELLMPMTSPKKSWEITDRFDSIDVLAKVVAANPKNSANKDAEYVLNSTHEEINVPIAQQYAVSYKDLPISLYQIQTKFRNEARPKSGLLRGREFRMKDMYSYHATLEDMRQYYELAKKSYQKVFQQLGIGQDTIIALASGGDFTDDYSHEFQTICETGEDLIFQVPSTKVNYNREVTPCQAPPVSYNDQQMKQKQDVLGKSIIGVEELASFLNIPVEKTTKTLLYETNKGDILAAVVRGGYDVDEEKLKKVAQVSSLQLASSKKVKQVTGAEVGYAGPLNLPKNVQLIFDESTDNRLNFECGTNKTNYHSINVNWERDLAKPDSFYDIKVAQPGDIHPDTKETYTVLKASEVGNIFPLHTKFSKPFKYTYTDEKGKQQPVIMGCYGIGTTRLMGVIVEKYHDEKGIIWPQSVAPFQVHLLSLPGGEEQAEILYQQLVDLDIEVLWDDRDVSAGIKFTDADLIGIPIRLVVSKKTQGKIEWKKRNQTKSEYIEQSDLISRLKTKK